MMMATMIYLWGVVNVFVDIVLLLHASLISDYERGWWCLQSYILSWFSLWTMMTEAFWDISQLNSRAGDITWLFTLIILPILIRIRIIAILLLNICFISKEDYPPEYHISASAQWQHHHSHYKMSPSTYNVEDGFETVDTAMLRS